MQSDIEANDALVKDFKRSDDVKYTMLFYINFLRWHAIYWYCIATLKRARKSDEYNNDWNNFVDHAIARRLEYSRTDLAKW